MIGEYAEEELWAADEQDAADQLQEAFGLVPRSGRKSYSECFRCGDEYDPREWRDCPNCGDFS